ncbi:DNA sulfur modification protein DndD [Rhizomicrobium electricum]|uniref:DNA sulfur modification protein DndD n=1 Tax=Rhizomicrobium electricum TaxID=480070 RepID=A0ABN1F292_9PROT|nr:DNA sulfur modification protein DndD [Rhizomicrobium electricum]NIJ50363.1 DNA sulfur modification protein DndD [Rhizomicrobium electricum]
MILRNIKVSNFGLFAGAHEIDLTPRKSHGKVSPIVLIGGQNGAGKTTLLDAVRLALYGRRALGPRVGQAEYESYLRSMIHRREHVRSASVGIEFDYAEAGEVHSYRVEREWSIRGKSLAEALLLEKDNFILTSVPKEEWHLFLQELIPPGLSQLFFFDGEKIREIADGEHENEQLAESVRGLLGIELVSRLRTDLGLFLARHQKGTGGATATRLEQLLKDIDGLDRQCAEIADIIADLQTKKDTEARVAEQIKRRFVAEGGDVAAKRGRLEVEKVEVQRQIATVTNELRELANGLLPFSFAPRLVSSFEEQLRASGPSEDRAVFTKHFMSSIDVWKRRSKPKRDANWSERHWSDLKRFINAWSVGGAGNSATCPAFREVGDGASAIARLSEVDQLARPRAVKLGGELETLVNRLNRLDASLLRADNAAAGDLLDDLRLAEKNLGATEALLITRQNELKVLRGQQVTAERERNKLLEVQQQSAATDRKSELAARTARSLEEYENSLLAQKLSQLQAEFVRCFNKLVRKQEFVANVRIDPKTFIVTLIDRAGNEVPKANLSAGEKQIYAIAVLWALARTSGRPLPMIIDTPLARLDSEHRRNLVESYFPAASHQVVLLSTDTEVDVSLVKSLRDAVSHSFRLDYDPGQRSTAISAGYFGDEPVRGTRHAVQ